VFLDLTSDGILDVFEPNVTVDLQSADSVFDLRDAASSQSARIYMIDLEDLVQNGVLEDPNDQSLPGAGPFTALGDAAYDFAANSFISDIISVDFDLDFTTDALYFGTTSGSPASWGGKMRRIVLSDPENSILPGTPGSWDKYSILFDAGRPITAAPALAMDRKKQPWIFFGTGRFVNRDDVNDTSQQTYYGIKEPWQDLPDAFSVTNGMVDINVDVDGDSTVDNEMTWAEISAADLLDVSDIVVYESGNILYSDDSTVVDLNSNNLDTFSALETYMDQQPTPRGWKLHFGTSKERNLGQAALLGDILSFTSYVPNAQTCQYEGDSYLYAVHYKTGTALSSSVIGFGATHATEGKEVSRKKGLGKGLAITPNIHTGREKGSKAYIQTSTGAIVIIGEENPGATKTGKTFWMEE
jgi:type IV pilus assembly protein PilY1